MSDMTVPAELDRPAPPDPAAPPARRGSDQAARLLAGLRPPQAAPLILADEAVVIWGSARPPFPADVWRIETDGADPQDHREAARRAWHRRPWCLPVRLAQYHAGEAAPSLVSEAMIGTRLPLADLETRIYEVAALLLRAALSGTPHGRLATVLPRARGRAVRYPALAEAVLGRLGQAWHRQRCRWLTEEWSVGRVRCGLSQLIATGLPADIDWAQPPPGTYWADPFPWPGTDKVLVEEVPLASGLGRIVALPRAAPGGTVSSETVLASASHLSYPCTARLAGQVVLLPEDLAGGTILYRLAEDGGTQPLGPIAPGRRLADPTIFAHGGLYWVAACDLDVGWHDNLCLFHAERLSGPWQPHRRDPARIDIRNARPAGTPFRHQGALYRPAQDCAETYGAAVSINLIERLDPDEFVERPVRTLHPAARGPYPDGLHTVSVLADGALLVDGKRMVFRPAGVLAKLRARLGRAAHG